MNGAPSPLVTPLCEALGIQVPVVQAPVGSACTPQLAAAVSNAGGLGMLAITWMTAREVGTHLQATDQLTNAPVGVNASLAFPVRSPGRGCS